MSANLPSTFSTEYITEAQTRILDEINKKPFVPSPERKEGEIGPVLAYIQDVYASRMETPNGRAELSQMNRAARFVTVCNGEKPSGDCQEFLCGEIFASEFVAHLIGTREGTGDLAQMAMSGFFEIARPGGESSETKVQLEDRHLTLAYSLQERLTSPDGLLPADFEALLDTLVLEKEVRTIMGGDISARNFDDGYPKFFVMGFRMIVNEAIASGMLESAYGVQMTQAQDPQKAVIDKFYGKPAAETFFDGTPVPTDAALDEMLEHSFQSTDYFLISDDRMTLEEQHTYIMARLRSILPMADTYDEKTVASLRDKAGKILTTYAAEKKLLTSGDLMSAQGNQFLVITESVEAARRSQQNPDASPRADHHFFNSKHEIRGEYIGMEVIGIPSAATLKKMLKGKLTVDPNDEAHHTLFAPAMRLKNPTITQQNDEGGFEGTVSIGEDVEFLVPIIYPNVFIAKFISSLTQEDAQSEGDTAI